MKKIMKYIVGAVLLPLAAGSCTDNFEKYNTNPNEPTKLTPSISVLIDCMSSAEENPCQRNNTFWAGPFGGYITVTNNWSKNFHFYTYNVDDDWNQWSVNWYYETMYPNYFSVLRNTKGEGAIFAVAQVCRVAIMQNVLTTQGPLPYSQVQEGKYTVAYDDEESAHKAMFDDLDAAISVLTVAAGDTGYRPLSASDRVYNGDYSKWVKFANTLKLRMAIRISGVLPDYAKEKAREAVQHSIGVMASADDTAWDNLNGRYKNGFYQVCVSWQDAMINGCITSYMNGYNDPRREKYFIKASDNAGNDLGYLGVRSGIKGITKATYWTKDGWKYSMPNVTETTPMLIFSASEAYFLRAEGALLGWAAEMGGSAKDLYEQGVKISFAERGATGVDNYLADDTSTPDGYTDPQNGKYNIAATSDVSIKWADDGRELERIITQKWIANFPLGAEAWTDYRRTGYPGIFPAVDNLSTEGVTTARGQRRLRFALKEYQSNRQNVQAAVRLLGGPDTGATDLWWAKKN